MDSVRPAANNYWNGSEVWSKIALYATERRPVHDRHFQIQHNHEGAAQTEYVQGVAPVRCGYDRVPFEGEDARDFELV